MIHHTRALWLARGDRYAQFYNTYFRHQSANYIPGSGFVAVAEGVARSPDGAER